MDSVASPPPSDPPQSLRERRDVSLTIYAPSYRAWNTIYPCHCEFACLRSGPQMAEPTEEEETDSEEDEDEDEELDYYEGDSDEDSGEDADDEHSDQAQSPPPSRFLSLGQRTHMIELMQGLYIALANEDLWRFDSLSFTHVVQVTPTMPIGDTSYSLLSADRTHLKLIYPASSLRLPADRTAMTPSQLGFARDFLALALPYGSPKWFPEEERRMYQVGGKSRIQLEDRQTTDENAQFVVLAPGRPDEFDKELDPLELREDMEIKTLIVAPVSRAIDVITIVSCYLAFLEDKAVENLTLKMSDDDIWEDIVLGPETVEQINLTVKSA